MLLVLLSVLIQFGYNGYISISNILENFEYLKEAGSEFFNSNNNALDNSINMFNGISKLLFAYTTTLAIVLFQYLRWTWIKFIRVLLIPSSKLIPDSILIPESILIPRFIKKLIPTFIKKQNLNTLKKVCMFIVSKIWLGLKINFPRKLTDNSFDVDDTLIFLKSLLPLIIISLRKTLKKHNLLEKDLADKLTEAIANIETISINTGGGGIFSSNFGRLNNVFNNK